jgi:chain length determinant protein EpsF
MTFENFLLVLRARWMGAADIFGAIVGTALLVSLLLPRQYSASATVVADVKTDPVAQIVFPAQLLSSYISTQVDIINSDRVAHRAAELLKSKIGPDINREWRRATKGQVDFTAWFAENLHSHLIVTPSRDSNVIHIGMQWSNPADAAKFANYYAQAYIDTNVSLKVEPAKQYTEYFNERSKALRAVLAERQKLFSDFQRDHDIIADEKVDIETSRMADLSSQLVAVEAQRQDSESRHLQSGQQDSLTDVFQNPLIVNLKMQLSAAEARREDLSTHVGKNHPDYLQASAEIESLRQRIARESANLINALGTSEKIDIGREEKIREALEEQKQRVLEMKRERYAADALQNDVATAQRDLDNVNQRLAASSLESLTQQTNVVLLTAATEPRHPSSPQTRLNLIIAAFVGTLLALARTLFAEYRDRRIRGGEDLAALTGAPLLASFKPARVGAGRRAFARMLRVFRTSSSLSSSPSGTA